MSASFALLPVFNALPGAFLLLSPSLVVEAASDDYLAVAMRQRAQLIGRFFFELFPDNPATPEVQGERTLRDSFARVLATGQPHELALQRYDLPDPAAPGQFVERYWLPSNRAVLDEAGRGAPAKPARRPPTPRPSASGASCSAFLSRRRWRLRCTGGPRTSSS
jgi:hypothetical protein